MAKRRPSGDGTIRKRTDGRWEGRVIIGHKDNGSPIFKCVFGKTQKELLAKMHSALEEYRDVDLSEDSNMSLGDWIDRWLKEYAEPTLRPNTIRGYTRNIENHIRPALGDKPIRFITTADVQKLYNDTKENGRKISRWKYGAELSDSTIRGIHMLLHEIMEAALKAHLISKNPTEGTTIPKCNYPPKKILNDAQLDKFMEAIKNEPIWHDFFYTEITTGLRRGEICGLKWSDLDEASGQLKVQRSVSENFDIGETKTETGTRTILLPPSTLHILKERHKTAMTEWIFPSALTPENPVAPSAAYHRLKIILKEAGLPDIRFHDLRHTFATHALANGVDPKTLSGILGHTNASFTLDTYTHVTTDMQKNAAGIVGGFVEEIFGLKGEQNEQEA